MPAAEGDPVGEDMARVLVADSHPPMRMAMRDALVSGGFEVCGEADDAAAAVAMAAAHRPELALVAVDLPGSGIAAAERMCGADPALAVVMMADAPDVDDFLDSLQAGARGYLLQDLQSGGLLAALRGVLAGEAAVPRALVPVVIGAVRLSEREWEVLELMRAGASTAEMAAELFVAPVTVRTHVASVRHKLPLGAIAASRRS